MRRTLPITALYAAALLLTCEAPCAATPDAGPASSLGGVDARVIAEDAVVKANINLALFEPPKVSHGGSGQHGIWTFYYVAKSHKLDACFSVKVMDADRKAELSWCS
jgi:hypothetical protein